MPRRKNKNTKLTPDVERQVLAALRSGADIPLAAQAVGMTKDGLNKAARRDPALREAIDAARAVADDIVQSRLFARTKHDTVACIFWLKNRRPEFWRDRHDYDLTSKGEALEFHACFAEGDPVPAASLAVPAQPRR